MSSLERPRRSSEHGETSQLSLEDIAEIARKPIDHTNLERTTAMIQRNAVAVLGSDLASRAESEMTTRVSVEIGHNTYARTGIRVFHLSAAKSLPAIALGMEWNEANPNLQVLSAALYEHQVDMRAQSVTRVSQQEELITLKGEIAAKIDHYKQAHPLTEDVNLILKLFTLPKIGTESRREIMRVIKAGRKDAFYTKLDKYRDA